MSRLILGVSSTHRRAVNLRVWLSCLAFLGLVTHSELAVTVTCLRVLAGQQVPPARKQKTTRTPRARTRSCIPVNHLRVSPSRNRHQHTDLSKTTSGRQACISFRALRRQISLKLHKIIQDPTLLLFSFCIDRKVVNLNKPCRRSRPS